METLMTLQEVAAFMRLSKCTIRRYVRKREIPFYKVSKVLRFRRSEIETWIGKNQKAIEAGQAGMEAGGVENGGGA